MCGIVGGVRHPVEPLAADLAQAVAALAHRGPNDRGRFEDPEAGLALGQTRLSVIDLSAAGHQPMASDDGRVHIVYNGEVYNFGELRRQLTLRGHRFRSGTDTEVILKAYLEWGAGCLKRFVGMFALALWDSPRQRLLLARDRLGIKPLYYHFRPGCLLFASELKALMAFQTFPRDLDPGALPLFLHFGYIPSPRSVFRDTWKLPPGHFAVWQDGALTVTPYWRVPPAGTSADPPAEALECLHSLLAQAVKDRLVSDVPLGALLSGGIDSSLVVALMQAMHPEPVRTFTIAFEAAGYNEAEWAGRVARHLGTCHTEFTVTAREAREVIARLPAIYDEPFADSSAIPTFLVSRLARGHVTVALSGDGGDEFFGGYERYRSTALASAVLRRLPTGLRRVVAGSLGMLPPDAVDRWYRRWRPRLPPRLRVANLADKWGKLLAQLGQNDLLGLYRAAVCLWSAADAEALTGAAPPPGSFEAVFAETAGLPLRTRLMRLDQRTYLPDAMLTKVDRASMAVSLEVRVPLLDHRVVEYAAGLPESFACADGAGKYPLRALLARYLPRPLFEREKMGFGVPVGQWMRAELKEMVCDYLSPARLAREGRLNPALVESRLAAHLSGRENHQHRLWALLMWEMWRERWLG
jgi:asparagine synthase (glutamine-hydrolysing)